METGLRQKQALLRAGPYGGARVCVWSLSRVQPSVTPWTVAHQAPLPMGFSRQEYWSALPFPPPGTEPALQANPLPDEPSGKPWSLRSRASPVFTTFRLNPADSSRRLLPQGRLLTAGRPPPPRGPVTTDSLLTSHTPCLQPGAPPSFARQESLLPPGAPAPRPHVLPPRSPRAANRSGLPGSLVRGGQRRP